MVKLNNGKKSMNRLLWILLFVSTSVLWAWDMDESMVNGSLVKLDSVRCPTCEISRYVETPGYECESCAFYVKCKEKNVVYEFTAGPMGSFEFIDGVTVSYGKTTGLKNCSVHFSFRNGMKVGLSKADVKKLGIPFKEKSKTVWEWVEAKRLGPQEPSDPNDWYEWQWLTIDFCKDKVCKINYVRNTQDSGP